MWTDVFGKTFMGEMMMMLIEVLWSKDKEERVVRRGKE
jgi:hypothetical protein